MKSEEQAHMQLVARYINEAAQYGSDHGNYAGEMTLETYDYALSYLRQVQNQWATDPGRNNFPVELSRLHIDALAECIGDALDGRRVFIETEFLRLMARPAREGHPFDSQASR